MRAIFASSGCLAHGALGRVLARAKMMTALTRIHGGIIPLITRDDRSGSGTPFTATAAITAGTSRPATITDAGFVHDSYGKGRESAEVSTDQKKQRRGKASR